MSGLRQEAEAVGQDLEHAIGEHLFTRRLMMANISSCLRMRPVFSISSSSACLRDLGDGALSSFKTME